MYPLKCRSNCSDDDRAGTGLFGALNHANSPLPVIDATGAITAGTGTQKFLDALPGFCAAGSTTAFANGLGQCIPIATPDTTTFQGSDFYRIGAKECTTHMHSFLFIALTVRKYDDAHKIYNKCFSRCGILSCWVPGQPATGSRRFFSFH
jgi:hypothetical protein